MVGTVRRVSVDLPMDQICTAMKLLPCTSMAKSPDNKKNPRRSKWSKKVIDIPAELCTGQLINYNKLDFKLAPNWSDGEKLVPTASALLDYSMGRTIIQSSMKDGIAKFNQDCGFDPVVADAEGSAYAIRALMWQFTFCCDPFLFFLIFYTPLPRGFSIMK